MMRMKKKFSDIIVKIVSNLIFLSTSTWIYLGVILGIISPMIIAYPFYLISWALIGQFFPYSMFESWLFLKYSINEPGVIAFIVFEFIIFAIGAILFLWGLIVLTTTIAKKEGICRRGPYRVIRHPQHMGIILMTFIVSLFVPWTNDLGIRTGAVFSWSILFFIIVLWSYYEEWRLSKKYGEDYLQYKTETGALLPKIIRTNKNLEHPPKIKHWIRLIFTVVGFAIFFILLYVLIWALIQEGILTQVY